MKTQLWLVASVGLAWIMSDADAALKVMSASNLLRVGSVENIFVECQDCPGLGPMNVEISVWNYPTKTIELQRTMLTLNSDNQYQALGELVIPTDHFNKDPTVKQFVYLQAAFPDYILDKVVLVSFQLGYMFIQTDRPLYTPDSIVNFRIFALTPDTKPIGKDEATVEIETQEGIVIPLGTYTLKEGKCSGSYGLGEFASIGQWKVVARFQSNPRQTYSTEFEVKDYVLPSYEVKLISETPFFHYEAQSFTVRVKVTYLFGGGVDGVAYVMFGVLGDDSRKVFPSSLQRISIIGGNGEATLHKDQIPNTEELIGLSLFVKAVVYTESASEMVEGELRNVPIVTTPYIISFDTTPKYFKPGMPFDVTVIVTNPDGSPAEGVPVVLEPGLHLSDTTQANGRVSLTVNTSPTDKILTITARTNDNRLPVNRQTTESMVARHYETKSKNYIQINVLTKNVKLGSHLTVTLHLNVQPRSFDITYLILSRGQLVHFGKQVSEGRVDIALEIPVTKKMLPSFRMIAYYHATPTEVVSDSVWVDVDDSCTSTLKLEPKNPAQSHESSSTFHLKVTGEPGATVGLVAVDKGLYALNNKHLLTQKKVWQILEKADTGCTSGGGRDSMGVFFDAGLMFQTDSAAGTPYRIEPNCPPSSMKKKALTFLSLNVEENSYKVNSPITVWARTKYPDRFSWIFFKIPACAGNPDCDVNTYDMDIPLKDSISTWTLTGISLSENNGICVGKPLDVAVFKAFFLDLRLPYSAVVGEQIEIRAILHNSLVTPITVEVELIENAAVCSSAWRQGTYTQQVRVGPSTTHAVPFVIIPMKEGVLNIEVKATVKDSWQVDEVIKPLRVVPNGVLTIVKKVLQLVPKGGTQEQTINNPIPKTEMVPNTPSSTKVFVTGKEPIRLQRVIGASFLGSLIYMPHGNGLSNIVHMNGLVTATISLDKTNQWEAVGLEKRSEAVEYIKMGIQTQMNYALADGSFFEIQNRKSSTWLTAYVIKVFSMAGSLVEIDQRVICNAVNYLIYRVQQPDGRFPETGQIYPQTYTGDLLGRDSDASMTAFCLIAILESRLICHALVSSLPNSIASSVAYLERRLPSVTNPYAATITSYALANQHKLNKEILYNFASPDKTHWAYPQNYMLSVEATAYALLALVNFLDEARPIVGWLTDQQGQLQSHGSPTAVTMYQALSEYWTVAQEPDYNLEVEVKWRGRTAPYLYYFNRENYYITKTTKAFAVNENVTVTARGTGEATLTLETRYYALPKETENCKFNLSLDFFLNRMDEKDGDIYTLRVRFFFVNNEEDSSMSVLDIALPTGFIPISEDLDAFSKGLSGFSSNLELNKAQSEKGSIVLYLDKVAHNRIEELAFRLRRTHMVHILHPAAVSLYEYYDETTKCVKYYHPQRRDGQIFSYCQGNECLCAKKSCGTQKKGHIGHRDRMDKACESSQTSQTDFVYKVILEDVTHDLSFDIYRMRIETVIKDGTLDRTASGQLRNFLSSPHCRESLNLQIKKKYLIMGAVEDIFPDTSTQSFKYLLSTHTWIESWPKGEQCQTEEHRPTCLGIKAFISMFEMFGCSAQ